MIFGIGTDITDCKRITAIYRKCGSHFLRHIFTPLELERVKRFRNPCDFIAGRWAAKEAFSKAMGTGMCENCAFTEIEIDSDARNKPFIRLYANTQETARKLGISKVHVSISHERDFAIAFVLIESDEGFPLPENERSDSKKPDASFPG